MLRKPLSAIRETLRSKRAGLAIMVLVLVAVPLLSWQLRTKVNFTDWQQAVRYAKEAHYLDIKEPLAYMTLRGFYLLVSGVCPGIDPMTTNAVLSCAEGGAFLILLYKTTGYLASRVSHRLIMVAFVMSSLGVTHLYLGDVEMRPTAALVTLAWIYVSLRFLDKSAGTAALGLVSGVAASTHLSNLFNLFSVPVLLRCRFRHGGWRTAVREAAVFVLYFLIPAVAVFYYTIFVANHIPNGSVGDHLRAAAFNLNGQSSKTLRDPSYIPTVKFGNEMFNLLVMVAPAAAALLAYLIVFKGRALPAAGRVTIFLTAALGGNLILPVILHESYEWEIQWPLYSNLALFMSLAAVKWHYDVEKPGIWARQALLLASIAVLMHTLPHILSNAGILL